MEPQEIPASRLRIHDSRYFWRPPLISDPLKISLTESGCLYPLACIERDHEIHLIDGFKRALFLEGIKIRTLPVQFLPPDTPEPDLLIFLASQIRESEPGILVDRILLLKLGVRLEISESILITRILPVLGFESHLEVLNKLRNVSQLPDVILTYARSKNLSLRQLSNLSLHPEDLLLRFFALKDELALSASLLEELLNLTREILLIRNTTVHEFFEQKEILEILQSRQSPAARASALRSFLQKQRLPRFSELTRTLSDLSRRLTPPQGVEISWDPALEKKCLQLQLQLKHPAELKSFLQWLNDHQKQDLLLKILEKL